MKKKYNGLKIERIDFSGADILTGSLTGCYAITAYTQVHDTNCDEAYESVGGKYAEWYLAPRAAGMPDV